MVAQAALSAVNHLRVPLWPAVSDNQLMGKPTLALLTALLLAPHAADDPLPTAKVVYLWLKQP